MLEPIIEGAIPGLAEVLASLCGDALVTLGITSVEHATGIEDEPNALLGAIGSVLIGFAIGVVSAFVVPNHLIGFTSNRWLNILAGPPAIGLCMEGIGRLCDRFDVRRPPLTTFWGSSALSLGVVLARYLLIR